MSHASVLAWLAEHAPDLALIDHARSTATVAEAAEVLGVEPGRIAKTLAFRVGDTPMLLLARGDARLDNAKCKAELGGRPRMLDSGGDAGVDRPCGWRGLSVRARQRRCRSSPTARCWPMQQSSPPPDR